MSNEELPVQGPAHDASSDSGSDGSRRGFFGHGVTAFMGVGLVTSYGTLAYYGGRFLFPSSSGAKAWQFVAPVDEFGVGESTTFEAPSGLKVVIARQQEANEVESFVALSSICPHLGCQVHWEANKDRFFCPCHNGAFDKEGRPTEGPPAAANQQLTRFPLRIESGLLYVEVPLKSVTAPSGQGGAL